MRIAHLGLLAILGCSADEPDPDDPPGEADADTDTDADADADADTDADTDCEVPVPTGDPATVPLGGACPLEARLGGWSIDGQPGDFSILFGAVFDAVGPIPLEVVGAEGPCELTRRVNPFCEPVCTVDERCGPDDDGDGLGDCVAAPVQQDPGCVTIGGLAEDVVLGSGSAADPTFAPDALVELRTAGTTFGTDVELHGVGFGPVDVGADTAWTIIDGDPLPIAWDVAGASPRSTVRVELNVDQHGNAPTTMSCELPDTGSAVLPAALLHELLAAGVSGFARATVTRHTVDSAEIIPGGCVDFTLASTVEVDTVTIGP